MFLRVNNFAMCEYEVQTTCTTMGKLLSKSVFFKQNRRELNDPVNIERELTQGRVASR